MTALVPRRAVERCEALAALGQPPPLTRPWKLRRWLRAYRAIMALDISEAAEMLREVYTPSDIERMAGAANPMYVLARKPASPYLGRKWVEPVDRSKP